MRRMLDPTKVGGGSGGTPRHVYMVRLNVDYYYIIYTTKDFNFTIGNFTQVDAKEFTSTDKYKELRALGTYPAHGFGWDDTNKKYMPLSWIRIDENRYGYQSCNSTGTEIQYHQIDSIFNVQIDKLF